MFVSLGRFLAMMPKGRRRCHSVVCVLNSTINGLMQIFFIGKTVFASSIDSGFDRGARAEVRISSCTIFVMMPESQCAGYPMLWRRASRRKKIVVLRGTSIRVKCFVGL